MVRCRSLLAAALLLVACDGSGTLGGDDDDMPGEDCTPGAVTVVAPKIELFWVGGEVTAEPVALAWVPGTCGPLRAEADMPFVVTTLLGDPADAVRVSLDPAAVVGGVHDVTIRLMEPGPSGDVELASFPVQVRALGSADPTLTRKTLVVGVDGTRGDAWVAADTPFTDSLASHAVVTSSASTQLAAGTVSGPGWTSILSGVDADKHRITGNGNYEDRDPTWPSLLRRASEAGLSTAAAIHWVPILTGILEADCCTESIIGGDADIAAAVEGWMLTSDHDLTFVHLDDVDGAGHGNGFSPEVPAYVDAIETADAHIGTMLDGILRRPTIADEHWMVVFTTDHGGEGTTHGPTTAACRTIPLIIASPSVQPGAPPPSASHLDVHPTVLDFLGIEPQESWTIDGNILGVPWEEDCGDGVDGDGDGLVDCEDGDCLGVGLCSCPDELLGAVAGLALAGGDTGGAGDDSSGTCGGDGAPDVALSWIAPETDTWTFDLTGSNRDFDTVLYARDGGCDGPELACNDDASGPQSAITLDLAEDQPITLVVDGLDGDSGDWRLNAEPRSSCPDVALGDAVGAAVSTGTNDGQGSSFFASCARSGRDVTLTWTAPSSGDVVFDTYGSGYDTVLHVLTGDCEGPEVACADDSGGGYQSEVTMGVLEGGVYTIVLSGFNGRPEAGNGGLPSGGTSDYVLNIAYEAN